MGPCMPLAGAVFVQVPSPLGRMDPPYHYKHVCVQRAEVGSGQHMQCRAVACHAGDRAPRKVGTYGVPRESYG